VFDANPQNADRVSVSAIFSNPYESSGLAILMIGAG
jgi:hypothetical protein